MKRLCGQHYAHKDGLHTEPFFLNGTEQRTMPCHLYFPDLSQQPTRAGWTQGLPSNSNPASDCWVMVTFRKANPPVTRVADMVNLVLGG